MSRRPPSTAELTYLSPVPRWWWPIIWDWMLELPDNNRDDDGPQTLDELVAAHESYVGHECTFGVCADGVPVGFVAYVPVTRDVVMTRGICFTKAVHGTGIPKRAVGAILHEVFAAGVRKVQAGYYTHNIRVAAFLRSLGAVEEGCLRDQVWQQGRVVSMKIVAIFADGGASCHSAAG